MAHLKKSIIETLLETDAFNNLILAVDADQKAGGDHSENLLAVFDILFEAHLHSYISYESQLSERIRNLQLEGKITHQTLKYIRDNCSSFYLH